MKNRQKIPVIQYVLFNQGFLCSLEIYQNPTDDERYPWQDSRTITGIVPLIAAGTQGREQYPEQDEKDGCKQKPAILASFSLEMKNGATSNAGAAAYHPIERRMAMTRMIAMPG